MQCGITYWSGWHFGSDGPELPKLDFLPVSMRRRMSLVSRLSLFVASQVLEKSQINSVRTVFASRHGEAHVTLSLFGEISRDELLSPLSFSRSVHNTSAGLYAIARGDCAPSVSIAGGRDTFEMGLLEGVLQAKSNLEPVLYVIAEETVPEMYDPFLEWNHNDGEFGDGMNLPHALALLIETIHDGPLATQSFSAQRFSAISTVRSAHTAIDMLRGLKL